MRVPREETSGSNQFMRDRFRREIGDRERENAGYDEGKRVPARERQRAAGREGKSESEMARGQPDRTLCQLSDLLVRRHEEALFTTKSLVDNAG